MPNTSSDFTLLASPADRMPPEGPVPSGAPLHTGASLAIAALEGLRPYQWLKNGLVFVPLALAHRITEGTSLSAAALTFLAFCLCASCVYLLNDLCDEAADRLHPHKRGRPIASGRLPHSWAMGLAAALLVLALLTTVPTGHRVTAVLSSYFVLMIGYSLCLKAVVLLDAMTLACGYALRVVAGAIAVRLWPSPWLLMFCIFFFFGLALLKRYAELALLQARDGAATHARAYLVEDQAIMTALGVGSGIAAVMVLALHANSGHPEGPQRSSWFLWSLCVLLLYWISYMWLCAHRGRMTDDPLVFALKERVSQALMLLMGITVWLAL